jgi:hypothetical protein
MLYARGWLLPATTRYRPGLDAINQLLIYSPFPLLLRLPLVDADRILEEESENGLEHGSHGAPGELFPR